jgi:hypothetical protein
MWFKKKKTKQEEPRVDEQDKVLLDFISENIGDFPDPSTVMKTAEDRWQLEDSKREEEVINLTKSDQFKQIFKRIADHIRAKSKEQNTSHFWLEKKDFPELYGENAVKINYALHKVFNCWGRQDWWACDCHYNFDFKPKLGDPIEYLYCINIKKVIKFR